MTLTMSDMFSSAAIFVIPFAICFLWVKYMTPPMLLECFVRQENFAPLCWGFADEFEFDGHRHGCAVWLRFANQDHVGDVGVLRFTFAERDDVQGRFVRVHRCRRGRRSRRPSGRTVGRGSQRHEFRVR